MRAISALAMAHAWATWGASRIAAPLNGLTFPSRVTKW